MPRKPRTAVAPMEVQMNEAAVAEDMAAHAELVRLNDQADAHVRAVAIQLGYQLPADCTDPDLIQRDISANMRRSVEACLEVGRGLRVLKEACEHGNFIARLDVLGIDRFVAAKFMQAATKFANVSSTTHLTKALGNQTKLFEMLVLDDEQLEELELTGQTGELKLDDIATMSVKELRTALREARQDDVAKTRLLAEKNAKNDELAAALGKKSKIKIEPWSDEVAGLKDDLAVLSKVMDETLGKVLVIIDATEVSIDKLDVGSDAHNGFKTVVHHLDETVARLATLVAGLRHHHETRLACYIAVDKAFLLPEQDDQDD